MPQHHRLAVTVTEVRAVCAFHPRLARATFAFCLTPMLLVASELRAAERAIDDVRFVKQGATATADVVFSCPVAYLGHKQSDAVTVSVRVELEDACRATIGGGLRSELVDPPGKTLAGVGEVVFETVDGRNATLVLRLTRAAVVTANQGRTRDVISVVLSPERDAATEAITAAAPPAPVAAPVVTAAPPPPASAPAIAATPPPAPATAPAIAATPPPALAAPPLPAPEAQPASEPPQPASEPPTQPAPAEEPPAAPAETEERRPLRLVQRPEEHGERFAIQLAADASAAGQAAAEAQRQPADVLYVSDRDVGGKQWQELRLGFFETEQQARARLAELESTFPQALIALADVAEQDRARALRVAPLPEPATAERADEAASSEPAPALSAERIETLLAEANDAMLAGNHARSIQIYSRLLEEPALAERRQVRERLGIARERNGQLAQAKLEYEAYLAEFPGDADAQRVRQRLAGLAGADTPRQEIAANAAPEPSLWEFSGGVAQYVRRDVREPLEGLPVDGDVRARVQSRHYGAPSRRALRAHEQGQRRVPLQPERRRRNGRARRSTVYLERLRESHGRAPRLGRTRRPAIVVRERRPRPLRRRARKLPMAPRHRVEPDARPPVEYPRHAMDAHRQFIGVSADLDQLVREWDFSFFAIAQEVDGIADRQATGAEARYRGENWSMVGAIDFDLSYSVLNSALVVANWRATDKLTLNGRVNVGVAPYLTTRNALIGRPEASVDAPSRDLLRRASSNASEKSHGGHAQRRCRRQLAAVRSVPGQRRHRLLRLRCDCRVGRRHALPDRGRQTFFYTSFVGSSIVKDGDTAMFSYRRSSTHSATSDTVLFDLRLPTTPRLRLNPRLA